MGTKQHSDCVFSSWLWDYGKLYHLINWYSLTFFYFLCSISLVLLMISLAVGVKASLIFFCFVVNWKLFLCESCEGIMWINHVKKSCEEIMWRNHVKKSFSSRFLGFWNCNWGLTSLTDFYKRKKENLKLIFLSPDNIKSYY